MKTFRTAALSGLLLAASLGAAEPAAPKSSTVPGPYPAMIQMNPVAAEPGAGPSHDALINSNLSGREIEFFRSAHESGQLLLALAGLGSVKASSEQITAVSKSLQTTQTEENKQVARLATFKGIVLSPALSPAQKKLADELVALTGPKFEKTWMERLIDVNQAAVSTYEAAAMVNDGDIKSFASQLLPLAKAKLQLANRLAGNSAGTAAATPAAK